MPDREALWRLISRKVFKDWHNLDLSRQIVLLQFVIDIYDSYALFGIVDISPISGSFFLSKVQTEREIYNSDGLIGKILFRSIWVNPISN